MSNIKLENLITLEHLDTVLNSIKLKIGKILDKNDALEFLIENDYIEPMVLSDGTIITSAEGELYIL